MHCNNQKAVTDTPGQQGKIIKSTNRTKREINTPRKAVAFHFVSFRRKWGQIVEKP